MMTAPNRAPKKIAVLSAPGAWHYRDLVRAAGDGQFEIFNIEFPDLAAEIDPSGKERFNLVADCVIVRTMPPGSLQQIVFRMDLLARLQYQGVAIVNPPKAIEAAVDKYLSLSLMRAAGIPIPTTSVTQTVEQAIERFDEFGGDVVVKPLFGSMGNGIKRLSSRAEARSHFSEVVEAGDVVYQQQFVDHGGFDIRLLVIGDEVHSMKRVNKDHWVTNINKGGIGEAHTATSHEIELAHAAANAVNAPIAGVDLMYDSKGNPYVIEVNAVPGWRAISKVLDLDIAQKILSFCESEITNESEITKET